MVDCSRCLEQEGDALPQSRPKQRAKNLTVELDTAVTLAWGRVLGDAPMDAPMSEFAMLGGDPRVYLAVSQDGAGQSYDASAADLAIAEI